MEQQEITALERLVGPQAKSPLFARLADVYLAHGRAQDALRVCDEGLANFPWYSTAHFVKGKILLALNMASEARREFEFVRDWMPTNPTVWMMLDSIPIPDDQLITAPLTEETPAHPPTEAPAAESPFSLTQQSSPIEAITESPAAAPAADDNVFGLPSEAPTLQETPSPESAPSPFSGFGGFDQPTAAPTAEPENPMAAFGGFGGFTAPTAEPAAEPTEAQPSGMAAFGGFTGTQLSESAEIAPATVGESFDQFSERIRPTLGPAGTQTLEDYLAQAESSSPPPAGEAFTAFTSPLPAAEPPAPPADIFTTFPSASPAADTTPPAADPFAGFMSTAPAADTPSPAPESTEPGGFSFGDFPSTTEPAPTSAPESSAPTEPTSFDFGGFPSAPEPATETTPVSASPEPFTDFSGPSFEGPDLSQPPPPPPIGGGPTIEELTEKLQNAKKITPVIDFSSKTSSTSSEDTLASSGFVTPTLAEIYAKQGWLDDAIKAYRTLIRTKPAEKDKFEARIAELEEQKKTQG